jgi:putative flippase GtrA
MKKIDIILATITGFGVGILFAQFAKGFGMKIPYVDLILPVLFVLMSLFGIWIAEYIGRRFLFVFQLAKFLLIGAFFALFDIVVLNALLLLFGITEGIRYSFFVGVSFVVATIVKYIADKYWAFEKAESSGMHREFISFFAITLVSGGIQVFVASFIVNTIGPHLGLTPLLWANLGKIGGITIASAWNFLGYKFIVFKK